MKYSFTFLFIGLYLALAAQPSERNALKAGFGLSRHIQQKVNAPTLMVAFAKDFYPRTMIEINAAWVTPVDVSTPEEIRELKSYRFGMNLLFKILEENKQAFNAGIGFSAGFYGTDWTIIATGEEGFSSEFTPGFTALLEYDYILPNRWFIGGRASISRFDGDRSTWFLGGMLGLRF